MPSVKKRVKKNGMKKRTSYRKRSSRRYSGAWGDGCGTNSIIEGSIDENGKSKSKPYAEDAGDNKKTAACYKPCDLTEVSEPLYCEHVGISAGGQYEYMKRKAGDATNTYIRERVPVPRSSKQGFTEKEKESIKFHHDKFQQMIQNNGWKKYLTQNINTSGFGLANTVDVGKAVAKTAANATATLALGTAAVLVGSNELARQAEKFANKTESSASKVGKAVTKLAEDQKHVHAHEMEVALAHKFHVHEPASVHLTPEQVKEEAKYEKEDLEELLKEFEENPEFENELKSEDPELYKAIMVHKKAKSAPPPKKTAAERAAELKAKKR